MAALVFPWNLAETARSAESIYAMARRHAPWAGDSRAEALRTVLRLAGGMRVLRADPGRGEVHLGGEGGSLIVWHNRAGWTDRPRNSFALELPAGARQVEVWGHDGLRRRLPTDGGARVEVTDLPIGQTYMFLVR